MNESENNSLPINVVKDTPTRAPQINNSLRVSEARYQRIFETAQDGILLLNAETAQIEDVNPFLMTMLGYSHKEFLGQKLWEFEAFTDTALDKEMFDELQATRYIRYDNLSLKTKDERLVPVEFISNVYDYDGIDVIHCNIRDNTKRHLAEIALRATERAFRMLSESNLALLKSTTEAALLNEYCRIAVETGGYQMAWAGLASQKADGLVDMIAGYDQNNGNLELSQIVWTDIERGNSPTSRAIQSGQIQLAENISIDTAMMSWQAEALKRGYRSVIALPFRLPDGVTACLTIYGAVSNVWSAPERKLLQEIADDLAFGIRALRTAIAKIQYQLSLRDSLEQTIQVIADTVEERDPYTAGHQRRVAGICSRIAQEFGFSSDRIQGLHLAATIHDLGKISIPAEILSKPRRLGVMEFNLIKEHPNIGFNILKKVNFPWPIAQIILQHHERIDGSGYPQGLKGDELLLESKILAVADIVEAMASHRPYRAALGIDAALDEITAQRGISLDAQVVDVCLNIFREQGYKIGD